MLNNVFSYNVLSCYRLKTSQNTPKHPPKHLSKYPHTPAKTPPKILPKPCTEACWRLLAPLGTVLTPLGPLLGAAWALMAALRVALGGSYAVVGPKGSRLVKDAEVPALLGRKSLPLGARSVGASHPGRGRASLRKRPAERHENHDV